MGKDVLLRFGLGCVIWSLAPEVEEFFAWIEGDRCGSDTGIHEYYCAALPF